MPANPAPAAAPPRPAPAGSGRRRQVPSAWCGDPCGPLEKMAGHPWQAPGPQGEGVLGNPSETEAGAEQDGAAEMIVLVIPVRIDVGIAVAIIVGEIDPLDRDL